MMEEMKMIRNNNPEKAVAKTKRYQSLDEQQFTEESLRFFRSIAANFSKVDMLQVMQ